MKYLLDTHTLLWWWTAPDLLSKKILQIVSSTKNIIFVSPVNAYEIGNKSRLGKLTVPKKFLLDFTNNILAEGWTELPITLPHTVLASTIESPHRDPFDRLLVAQAIIEGATLLTADHQLDTFPKLKKLW
jgi:PIN domain nuclease of toxin-antitoxin system